jgi:hypothetical protein
MAHKLTKQGVRDLGGNFNLKTKDAPAKKIYQADIGFPDSGGVMVDIQATSLRDAISQGNCLADNNGYGAMLLQIRFGKKVVWDYMNGAL